MGKNDQLADILNRYPQDPRYLLAILLDIQEEEKYLSIPALNRVALYLDVPESRVFAVATFYSTLSLRKKGRRIIRVCMGTACHLKGSHSVLIELQKQLGINNKETTDDGEFTLETVNCIGACALAPVVTAGDRTYCRMSSSGIAELIKEEVAK